MRGGPVAVSRITKSENCAAAQRRGASESVPLLGMRDMAVAAATVFMAFEPGRLPIVLGFANWLKFHVPMVMGASAWMFVISPTPEGREMPAPLMASGKGRSNTQQLSDWNRLSGPMHWRLPIRRPLCYGIALPVRGFAVP